MPPSVFPSTTGSRLLPQNCASVMGAPATIAIGIMNLRTATGITRCDHDIHIPEGQSSIRLNTQTTSVNTGVLVTPGAPTGIHSTLGK